MRILLVDDNSADGPAILAALHAGLDAVVVEPLASLEALEPALRQEVAAMLVVHDARTDAFTWLSQLRAQSLDIPCLVLTSAPQWENAVALLQSGACDYLPITQLEGLPARIMSAVTSAAQRQSVAKEVQELRTSEERYRHISRLATDYAYIYRVGHDLTFHVEWISDAFMKMTGYQTVAEVVACGGWRVLIHPDDLPGVLAYRERLLAGETVESDYRVIAKNGAIHWIHNLEEQLDGPNNEYLSRVAGASHEITARKAAEESLREQEARLRLALEAAEMSNWEWRLWDDAVITGDNHLNLMGGQPATREHFQTMIHPDDRERIRLSGDLAVTERSDFHGEFRVVEPSGNVRWYYSHGRPLANANGEVERLIGVTADITERKQAEELLREKEERLRLALEAVGMITWEWHPETDQIIVDQHGSIRGAVRNDFLSALLLRVHPADRQRLHEATLRAVKTGELLAEEYRVPRKDGTDRWFFGMGRAFTSAAGQPSRMIGVTQDITERMQMRLERLDLLEREHSARLQLEAAVQQLTTIQAVTDVAVTTLELKDLLQAMLERVLYRLKGETAAILLLSEDGQQLVVQAARGFAHDVNAAVEGAQLAVGEGLLGKLAERDEPVLLKDWPTSDQSDDLTQWIGRGTRSLMGVPLRASGRVIGVLHVGAKASEIFAEDDLNLLMVLAERVASAIERTRLHAEVREGRDRLRTLSRRLMDAQETERRRIARELHDETGQALTAVKLNLQSLKRRHSDLELGERLDDSLSIVEESLNSVRNISHELRPSILDDLGLVAALRWYVDRQAQRAGFTPHFRARMIEERLPAEIETACFRIVQEAITNIIRHAAARQVWVELQQTPQEYRLVVRDDGIGFNVRAAREHAVQGHSLGLLGMQERAQLAGGQFELRSSKKGGAELTVRFAHAVTPPEPAESSDTLFATSQR